MNKAMQWIDEGRNKIHDNYAGLKQYAKRKGLDGAETEMHVAQTVHMGEWMLWMKSLLSTCRDQIK